MCLSETCDEVVANWSFRIGQQITNLCFFFLLKCKLPRWRDVWCDVSNLYLWPFECKPLSWLLGHFSFFLQQKMTMDMAYRAVLREQQILRLEVAVEHPSPVTVQDSLQDLVQVGLRKGGGCEGAGDRQTTFRVGPSSPCPWCCSSNCFKPGSLLPPR